MRNWNKIISTSQNTKYLLKNQFILDEQKALNRVSEKWKKVGSHQTENPFPPAIMKESFRKYFYTLTGEKLSMARMPEKWIKTDVYIRQKNEAISDRRV